MGPPDGGFGSAERAENADAAALLLGHVRENEQQNDHDQQHGGSAQQNGHDSLTLTGRESLFLFPEVVLHFQSLGLRQIPAGGGMILGIRRIELEIGLAVAVFAVHEVVVGNPTDLLGRVALRGIRIDLCDKRLPRDQDTGRGAAAEEPDAGVFMQHGQHLDGGMIRFFYDLALRQVMRVGRK